MARRQPGPESGFSLLEMMMALVVTLIVSGAVYGLLSGGQSAFRREPELTDRQQNARIAMNLIMRDIANAGSGMPKFIQTFTQGLNACAGCPDGGAPLNADNVRTDELEILTNTGSKENEPACHTPGQGNSTQVRMVRNNDALPENMIVLLFTTTGEWTIRNVVNTSSNNSGAGNCDNADHTGLNFNSGANDVTGLNQASGVCEPNGWGTITTGNCEVSEVSFATVVRYRIRNDASGVPVLQRFSTDDVTLLTGGTLVYQTVARGIEDLQAQYTQASTPNTWVDGAPQVVNNNYATLINQVRVTLVARAEGRQLTGARTSASGRKNVRGTLTSTGSPRSTLYNLASAPAAQRQWW